MSHRLTHLLLPAVLAVAALLVPTAAASAADDTDDTITWMVRPSDGVGEDGRSWIEQELDPGAVVEEYLLVRNLSAVDVTFQLAAADAYFTENGRFNMLSADQESVDAGTWIDIQPSVDVPSGGDVIVPFTITVPDNATPGDHPAGVAAAIRSGGDDEVGIESRVGFRVMTRVTGELAPSMDASISGAYQGTWNPFETGRLDATYEIANTGNTRLTLSPTITASTLFGLVSTTISGEEIAEMAPGETRPATVSFPSMWPLFAYTLTIDADASAVSDELAVGDSLSAEESSVVIAFPWPQLVVIVLAILIIWWLWRDRRRRESKFEERLEQAREEGRAHAETPVAQRTAVRAALVSAVAIAALLLGPSASWADEVQDQGSVSINVEVTPGPTPTPTVAPTPPPSPSGIAGDGDLPPTGGPDVSLLVAVGLGAVALGTAAVLLRRRRAAGGSSR